jgi:hypothetical protein
VTMEDQEVAKEAQDLLQIHCTLVTFHVASMLHPCCHFWEHWGTI